MLTNYMRYAKIKISSNEDVWRINCQYMIAI